MEGSARARRSTAKKVDYAKEQEFSDVEDIFEDSPNEEAPRVTTKSKRGRKKRAAVAVVTSSSDHHHLAAEDDYDTLPVFTEKGYDPTLTPIRERFPFLPEYEEDGSPRIELIVGRRPVDEKEDAPEEEEEENKKDERLTRRSKSKSSPDKKKDSGPVEYEYLVKYKGRSYLHLEWKSGADLESMNKSAKGIYRRYIKKVATGVDEELENPEFDPSFALPEKIIDEADQEIQVELTDKELLRWEKEREKELEKEETEEEETAPEGSEEHDAKEIGTEDGNQNGNSSQEGGQETTKPEGEEKKGKLWRFWRSGLLQFTR